MSFHAIGVRTEMSDTGATDAPQSKHNRKVHDMKEITKKKKSDSAHDSTSHIQSPIGSSLPATGYLRLQIIIGNPKSKPPILPIIPVSKSSWWAGVKSGLYPQPVKLGPRTTAWKVEDIRELIAKLGGESNG